MRDMIAIMIPNMIADMISDLLSYLVPYVVPKALYQFSTIYPTDVYNILALSMLPEIREYLCDTDSGLNHMHMHMHTHTSIYIYIYS